MREEDGEGEDETEAEGIKMDQSCRCDLYLRVGPGCTDAVAMNFSQEAIVGLGAT